MGKPGFTPVLSVVQAVFFMRENVFCHDPKPPHIPLVSGVIFKFSTYRKQAVFFAMAAGQPYVAMLFETGHIIAIRRGLSVLKVFWRTIRGAVLWMKTVNFSESKWQLRLCWQLVWRGVR
ncbi:hypothetical protein TH25_10685 [Thalassospira profundimaris]|uniref:Uncharacterized protein n=1 Tax=Thalassospira profundimaris TaxID=502049 RepID=A0A367XAX1_9PROT|nr:hypothetical protein [Thalassospira profundimaris]RCK50737.1 hypothetical protein TH25_10685 [Thalassospira profundimaris]